MKPVLVIPIAVTAAVAIVIALVWVNSRRTEQREYLAMQQELAQLNTASSLREVPPQMPVLTLKPGSVRSPEQQSELKARPDVPVAELRLLWMQEDYPEYQLALRVPGARQSYVLHNLKAEKEDGKFIRVRLPAHNLAGWTYLIELSGVSADGATGPAEIYDFSISK
jgi:hypothetical protein